MKKILKCYWGKIKKREGARERETGNNQCPSVQINYGPFTQYCTMQLICCEGDLNADVERIPKYNMWRKQSAL